jgi:hypothetical protein
MRTRHSIMMWLLWGLLPCSSATSIYAALELQAPRPVSRAEILEAMEQAHGYDPTATTNGARFQAEVLLYLARTAQNQGPSGPPLFVGYSDWFYAFLQVTGRTEATAPSFSRLAFRHKQNVIIDYQPERVIQQVKKGPQPDLAINVKIWWEKTSKAPDEYTYQDTLSTPHLKVTNHREMSYRLLDFTRWIVYDEIKGLTGRPTSGVLGFLFRLIGEGRVVESRMAISPDGIQITRAQAEKAFFDVTTTVTVSPDGFTQKDVPPERPDLQALETLISQELDIEYVPF